MIVILTGCITNLFCFTAGNLSPAIDGNLTTCLNLKQNLNNKILGQIIFVKDVHKTKKIIDTTFNTEVNCKDANTLHYRKVTPECSYLKTAALETGSAPTGTICGYVVPCNDGNVTCKVDLVIIKGNVDFSLCEIELWVHALLLVRKIDAGRKRNKMHLRTVVP